MIELPCGHFRRLGLDGASLTDLLEVRSAEISTCGRYRYRLDRRWDSRLPPLVFGMLNPSTADGEHNDATVERCQRRAIALGYGSLIVWNLFAFRSTDPRALVRQNDPVGPENDAFILRIFSETSRLGGTVVVGWGAFGALMGRDYAVHRFATQSEIRLMCLGRTKQGAPRHPLYVSYQAGFEEFSLH